MEENRQRLADRMNDRRRELRIRWTGVARRAGMTPQNLLRIRKGDISVTWEAADGIDDALQWRRGSVQAILEGREPIPLPQQPGPNLRDETEEQIWSMTKVPEELRLAYIDQYREEQAGRAAG